MKHTFFGAFLVACLSAPASASSILVIDDMVTGPKGSSVITLGTPQPCADVACVDKTGGPADLNTASAALQASLQAAPLKKINFDFARKYPDPSSPVATPAPTADTGNAAASPVPTAPADSGTVAAQPPVQPQPDSVSMGAPSPDAPESVTRGSIDPNAPVLPVQSAEAREGE